MALATTVPYLLHEPTSCAAVPSGCYSGNYDVLSYGQVTDSATGSTFTVPPPPSTPTSTRGAFLFTPTTAGAYNEIFLLSRVTDSRQVSARRHLR